MHGEGLAGVAHQCRDVALGHTWSHTPHHAEDRLADAQGSPGERGDLVGGVTAAQTVGRIHEHGGHVDGVRPGDAADVIEEQRGRPGGAAGIVVFRRGEVLPADDADLARGGQTETVEDSIETRRRFSRLPHETESLEKLDLQRQTRDRGVDDPLVADE
ncbi:MAG: hypothetical protein K0S14_3426, partial [Thermomicrobiales bacterium]|nr:hypothetical protein [Thermomicrobiales bacterium]